MNVLDRLLLLIAVVSGLLTTHGAVFADPDPLANCTDTCQQTTQHYDCTKKIAYEYELDDCYHCVAIGAGNCVSRDKMPGGKCTKRDMPRKFRYTQNYKQQCDCTDMVTRVEAKDGVAYTPWDLFPSEVYYTCEVKAKTDP